MYFRDPNPDFAAAPGIVQALLAPALPMAPINAALAAVWPQARCMNLLDDSLSADLARGNGLNVALHRRFEVLADYAVATGADALLFTCSAFGGRPPACRC